MNTASALRKTSGLAIVHRSALGEESFHRMISIESRRTERSRKPFLLMLLDMGEHATSKLHQPSLEQILKTLAATLRETDVTGWYKKDQIVGVMFTEITLEEEGAVPSTLMTRVSEALEERLTTHQFHQVAISFHLLPEARPLDVPHKPYSVAYPIESLGGTAETAV